ncbi:MAG: hypothetical protein K2K39_01390 [Clostridia bacterium]|nr:hypothetical protein [Clostridia bacterium]
MEEDNGLTFTDVLKVILKRIWWVVGSMAIALIAVVLIIQLWYNPTVNNYSVSFEISYPDSESGKYPDGSTVLLSDSITYNALNGVVNPVIAPEETNKLSGIDVRKMVDNDDISIAQDMSQSADGSIKRVYTLSVKAKYFKNDDQAAIFIRKVASYPVAKVNKLIASKNYEVYLDVYNNATTYEDKIQALLLQKQYLETNYKSLVIADSDVETNLAQLNNVFTTVQRQYLLDTIVAKYYVLDTENYLKEADMRIAALKNQQADNDALIEAQRAERAKAAEELAANGQSMSLDNEYDKKIVQYVEANAKLQNDIDKISETCKEIEKYTDDTNDASSEKKAFDELLESYNAQLKAATDILAATSKTVYADNTRVIFSNNKIEKKGGRGVIMSALIGAVLGLVISAAVICIIDLPKYKKSLFSAAQSGEVNAASDESVQTSQEDTAEEKKDEKADEE